MIKKWKLPGGPEALAALSRRDFGNLLVAGMGSIFLPSGKLLQGSVSAKNDKFFLFIHCGSWDGYASGLLMPNDVGVYPRGVFQNGIVRGSANPLLNIHEKTGSLVFNNYNKILAPIANHMCYTVGNPRNLDHGTARWYQSTGGNPTSVNASWSPGVAQALNAGNSGTAIVNSTFAQGKKRNGETGSVAITAATNRDMFVNSLSDHAATPGFGKPIGDLDRTTSDRYWAALKNLNNQRRGPIDPTEVGAQGSAFIDNLMKGVPALAAGQPIVTEVESAISRTAVNNLIDSSITDANDGAAVKATLHGDLLTQLQLAAMVIKAGVAKSMSISVAGNQDFHTPSATATSSSVATARSGGQLSAQIRVFWDWIIANGFQDKVMVVVTHEFARGPYNQYVRNDETIVVNNTVTAIEGRGTDHWLTMGMIFLNGKVPSAGRVGSIIDGYSAVGSSDLIGTPDMSVGGYSSTQLIGSMLMRCFDDVFVDDREVKRYWPDFVPIPVLVG